MLDLEAALTRGTGAKHLPDALHSDLNAAAYAKLDAELLHTLDQIYAARQLSGH